MLSKNEVKYIQSLYHKKKRDEHELFITEGVKAVEEILHSDWKIKKIYAVKEWLDKNENADDAIEVSDEELKRISSFQNPNKVIAIVEKKNIGNIPSLQNKINLVLDGIQDPGNLGTIIRTADWFGIENIIASNDTADVYNSKVIQSSMGSFAHVNIFYTNLESWLAQNTIPVLGAFLEGENVASIKPINECLLIIGNEGNGIRLNILPFIQQKISIAKQGNAESLNAAVAAGILMWKLVTK